MNYPQAVVSIVVFSICLLLGLPVWWNTTKVYRAQLPHQRIMSAQSMLVKLSINVDVLFYSDTLMNNDEELVNVLSNNNYVSAGIYQFEFNFKLSKTSMEDIRPKHYCSKLESVHETTHNLRYRFVILQDTSSSNLCYYCDNTLDTILITNNFNGTVIGDKIISVMKLYLNIKELSSNFQSHNVLKPVKHNLNMPPAVSYSIVLTLAVANPSDYMPSWNVEDAIDRYLYPLLLKLDFLGPIKVSSQVIYFVDFKEKPYKVGDNFYYSQAKLPLLMNEIQPRLKTYTSTDASLNFIVYIPPAKFVPLYIKSEKKDSSSYDAFHSARWGGLQLFNPNVTHHRKKVEVPIDTLIKKFVLQFGELFGLSHSKYVNIFPKNQIKEISEWSRTSLLISKNFEYLSKCLNTLTSLYKLLGEIENIVISEEIRYLIESSLENYEQSVKFLANGFVNDAVKHSKSAFEFSEKAFYDASLLALLYFPDDQKYAIYVPLFLPVAFPIFASVYRSLCWWRNKEGTV